MQFILSGWVTALVGLSCTAVTYPPRGSGTRSHFNQSCGAACGAPISSGTGEILAPAATGTGQLLDKVVRAAEALQGFINVSRFLDEAQKDRAEKLIIECVKEANFKVNEELFGQGKSLPASDCDKPPTAQKKLAPDWARHLGKLKHAAAFRCIQQRLAEEFPNNFSVEPRYRRDEFTNDLLLTDRWAGSRKPDIVLHFTRNATRIQCIYELKFPCGNEQTNPWDMEGVRSQMDLYRALGGECGPAIVTPQLELSRQ